MKITQAEIEKMINIDYVEYIHNEWISNVAIYEVRISKDEEWDEPYYTAYIDDEEVISGGFKTFEDAKKMVNSTFANLVCDILNIK